MRAWLVLSVAVAVAIPTHLALRGPVRSAAPAVPAASDEEHARDLGRELQELGERARGLSERLGERLLSAHGERRALAPTHEIEAAARRWMAQRRAEVARAEVPDAAATAAAAPLRTASMDMDELRLFFGQHQPFDGESQALFEELRESGRLQDYLEAARLFALDHPNDPEAHMALGLASLQSLFGMDPSPESGLLAMEADTAFDRALELDPGHLDARWSKAIALSNWPTFMGKTGEAIEHFEILIEQTSAPGDERGSAEAHVYLGNLYQRIGENERALEAWRQGLTRYPGDAELERQIELAEGRAGEN